MSLNSLPTCSFWIFPQITFEIIRRSTGERDTQKSSRESQDPWLSSCPVRILCSRARGAPFQSPQSRHWICSDNSLASNPHQIPTLQCFIPKSPETSPSPGLSRTDPLGRSKEEAAQLFVTRQTSGWGHIWKQETSQEQRLMGFWESKFKQCAHGPGVIINQSKSGEYVAVFCSYAFGHSTKTAATCRFPDCPQPVLAYKLKYQLRYFSPPHLYLFLLL